MAKKVSIEDIKKLRAETNAGVIDVQKALTSAGGDFEKAKKSLLKKAQARADKKSDRSAGEGLIHSYIHLGGKIGTMVHLACETDFVAKTEDFKALAHELALQIATDDYSNVDVLLDSEYIREPEKKVGDLVKEVSGKLGEKIEVKKFVKYSIAD